MRKTILTILVAGFAGICLSARRARGPATGQNRPLSKSPQPRRSGLVLKAVGSHLAARSAVPFDSWSAGPATSAR